MSTSLVDLAAAPETPLSFEMTPATAAEIHRLGLACLIDIRQGFELEIKGALEGATHIPFFSMKQLLGFALSDEEQEMLDADEPTEMDILSFIGCINRLQGAASCTFLLICNSGRRSLCAARLLRRLGYGRSFSVRGGVSQFQAPGPVGS